MWTWECHCEIWLQKALKLLLCLLCIAVSFCLWWLIRGEQLPRHENTRAVLWRGPCGEEWSHLPRAIGGSHQENASSLADTSVATAWETHTRSCFWIPDPQKMFEVIKACCLKLLSFGKIWYTAVENQCYCHIAANKDSFFPSAPEGLCMQCAVWSILVLLICFSLQAWTKMVMVAYLCWSWFSRKCFPTFCL